MTLTTLKDLTQMLLAKDPGQRLIIGIAGPPGSGKSTMADALCDALNTAKPGLAAVLPMDGFHFDDAVLVTRGWRPRKGAPHTFDVNGFLSVLDRLRANQEDEIAVPVFFREEEIAHNAARMIARQVGILIVEGNYLLLDQDPWTALRFDTTIYLDVPKAELRRRLEDRWQDLTGDALRAKMDENDMPNVELVLSCRRPADFIIQNI